MCADIMVFQFLLKFWWALITEFSSASALLSTFLCQRLPCQKWTIKKQKQKIRCWWKKLFFLSARQPPWQDCADDRSWGILILPFSCSYNHSHSHISILIRILPYPFSCFHTHSHTSIPILIQPYSFSYNHSHWMIPQSHSYSFTKPQSFSYYYTLACYKNMFNSVAIVWNCCISSIILDRHLAACVWTISLLWPIVHTVYLT